MRAVARRRRRPPGRLRVERRAVASLRLHPLGELRGPGERDVAPERVTPVVVYDQQQLRKLSSITGLSYQELEQKSLNEVELARILADIEGFARTWDALTFRSVARKVNEIHPEVDLFELLRRRNPALCNEVRRELSRRSEDD
mgnify:CR=1 FL=1